MELMPLFGDDKESAFDKLKRFDTNNNGKIDAGKAIIPCLTRYPVKPSNDNFPHYSHKKTA